MMVEVVRIPSRWAVVITSSHWVVVIRPFEMTARTSSSRISAEVPGSVPSPASRSSVRYSRDRQPGARDAVEHFLGGERVDVEVRQRALDRPGQLDVEAAVELGRQPGLDAHLGGAQLRRLAGAAHHFLHRQEVALFLPVVPAERAEGAVLDADVGEVDVAVDDEGHQVAGLARAQLVGDERQRLQLPPGDLRERQRVGDRDLGALERAVQRVSRRPGHRRRTADPGHSCGDSRGLRHQARRRRRTRPLAPGARPSRSPGGR